jgi:ornithine cyclodeaminase
LPGVQVVQIAGRHHPRAKALVDDLLETGTAATALPSIEDAVRSADVVCAATHADEPVVRREWLRPGTHVNSVGYNIAGEGEVDVETMRDALVVVESRSAALTAPPAGAVELARAIEAGAVDADLVQEIGEIAAGDRAGRTDAGQLTLYKSVGVAVQDAAAAGLILEAAHARGVGTEIEV